MAVPQQASPAGTRATTRERRRPATQAEGGQVKAQPVKDGLVKRGSTWSYIVRVRDPQTGKMKDQWKGGFATQTEARTARNDARSASDKGTAVAATRITVSEYLQEWLEASETRVRPTTLASYRQHVDGYIVPRIGGERLQQLTPTMVDKLYATLLKEGRAPKTKPEEGEKPATATGLSASAPCAAWAPRCTRRCRTR